MKVEGRRFTIVSGTPTICSVNPSRTHVLLSSRAADVIESLPLVGDAGDVRKSAEFPIGVNNVLARFAAPDPAIGRAEVHGKISDAAGQR
jgi:hypothetical protein